MSWHMGVVLGLSVLILKIGYKKLLVLSLDGDVLHPTKVWLVVKIITQKYFDLFQY